MKNKRFYSLGLYYNGCSSIVYGRLRKFSEEKGTGESSGNRATR